MIQKSEIPRLIFGLKVQYYRKLNGLSYQQLASKTGMSLSYLHDIEKAKKYPKTDKIMVLAEALGLQYDELVSMQATKKLQPIIDLLNSEFFQVFPLEMFGIGPGKLLELFSNTPNKINAFISTIISVGRNYQFSADKFYQAALRSYQNLHDNYFEEIELLVKAFRKEQGLKRQAGYSLKALEDLLDKAFGIKTDYKTLGEQKLPDDIRSFYREKDKKLLIRPGLEDMQVSFLLCRELGFQFMKIKDRPLESRVQKITSFEQLLSNFKASYFSAALLMDEDLLVKDFKKLASAKKWNANLLLDLLTKYQVTPEMLLQRLTNILPGHFGIKQLFFLRLSANEKLQHYRMTKELHLSRPHDPYANELNEHYCRRWISIKTIVASRTKSNNASTILADAQVSDYWESPNKYLCLSLATNSNNGTWQGASVTLGLFIGEKLKELFHFLDDPDLKSKEVHTTCERCSIPDCGARVAPPLVIEKERERAALAEMLKGLEG